MVFRAQSFALGLTLALLTRGTAFAASGGFMGAWGDNANQGLRIGKLHVSATSVEIGRQATYAVKTVQDDRSGAIFKVTGSSRRPDPFGCGPDGRVTYVVLKPLPPIPGFAQQAIRLYFYGGAHVPEMRTLDADPAVCAVHPFGRSPQRAGSN